MDLFFFVLRREGQQKLNLQTNRQLDFIFRRGGSLQQQLELHFSKFEVQKFEFTLILANLFIFSLNE